MQDIGIVFKRPEIYTLLFLTYLQFLISKKGVLPKFHCTVPGISIGTKKARSTGARIGFAIEILFLQAVATHWFCKRTAGPKEGLKIWGRQTSSNVVGTICSPHPG